MREKYRICRQFLTYADDEMTETFTLSDVRVNGSILIHLEILPENLALE